MRCILQLSKSNPDDLLRKKRKTFVQNIQEKCEKIVYLKGLTKLCRRFIIKLRKRIRDVRKIGKGGNTW